MSFLGLENLHAFVTGAAGGIGSQVVTELLSKLLYQWIRSSALLCLALC